MGTNDVLNRDNQVLITIFIESSYDFMFKYYIPINNETKRCSVIIMELFLIVPF